MNPRKIKFIIIDSPTESMNDIANSFELFESMIFGYLASDDMVDDKGQVTPKRIKLLNEHREFITYGVARPDDEYKTPSSVIPINHRIGYFMAVLNSFYKYTIEHNDHVDYIVVFTDVAFRNSINNLLLKPNTSLSDSIDYIAKLIDEEFKKEAVDYEIINWVGLNTFNLLFIYDVIKDSIVGTETVVGIRPPDINNEELLLS